MSREFFSTQGISADAWMSEIAPDINREIMRGTRPTVAQAQTEEQQAGSVSSINPFRAVQEDFEEWQALQPALQACR